MKRIFLVAALAAVTGVAGCPESNPDPGGTGGGGGQVGAAGSGGSAGTGGIAGSAGTGGTAGSAGAGGRGGTGGTAGSAGTGGSRSPDAPVRRDSAAAADGAVTAGACGFSRCRAGTICCDPGCGVCAAAPCPQAPPRTCGGCTVSDDCRKFDDYCGGCNCRGLRKDDPDPVCDTAPVMCIRQPCGFAVAICRNGRCVTEEVLR